MFNLDMARDGDITSLRNWLDGTGCLAREESTYLTHRSELVSLAPVADSAMLYFETWVEGKLNSFCRRFRKGREYFP